VGSALFISLDADDVVYQDAGAFAAGPASLTPVPSTGNPAIAPGTSQGTVHLILGGGGTDANLDSYGLDTSDGLPQAKVFTRANRPVATSTPNVYSRPAADAVEDATWSAIRDTSTGYGIAVFDVDPGGRPGEQPAITVRYFHAAGADPGQPGHRRTGRADAHLYRVRDVPAGAEPPLRPLNLVPVCPAALASRLSRAATGHQRLAGLAGCLEPR
jgi:hypothetical protein